MERRVDEENWRPITLVAGQLPYAPAKDTTGSSSLLMYIAGRTVLGKRKEPSHETIAIMIPVVVVPAYKASLAILAAFDKKHKRIGSRDCDSGFSLRASLAIYIYGDCGSPYSSYKSY
jgi:hypothetical protein